LLIAHIPANLHQLAGILHWQADPMSNEPNRLDSYATELWPALPLSEWKETCDTLHMWTQIVGKVRTALSPPVNHFWHSTLYVNPRGLTTSAIPYGKRVFEVEFDFVHHNVIIRSSDGSLKSVPLFPRSVADFYNEFMSTLRSMGIDVKIWTMPQEFPEPIPFDRDQQHASYDTRYVQRLWRILLTVDGAFKRFRSNFIGKCSPVHFFWGSFDLAVTRFSGRRAPERPGADAITREAYSHECSSVGWWPGGGPASDAAFYAYTAPAPDGYAHAQIEPANARFASDFGEFILPYDDVRRALLPEEMLMAFLHSTYEAGATLAHWDRANLERSEADITALGRLGKTA
jgi:hypothetical protein